MSLSTDTATRKLAAVMFTDIRGFSKKMAHNETEAFELLRTHDALMRVIASKYEGKVVKSIGDSFMVDYASAVNAVKAAIDAQKRFWTFNKGKTELDMIEVRIGIHLGDVMVSGDDMYGDGVNIASRIEAITEPNRICITADIYNQVKNKMDIKVFRMGNIPLRNIPEPVEVFEVLIDTIPELAEPSATARQAQERVVDTAEVEAEEATSIEAAKKQVNKPVPKVEDTASQVEALYKKAEQLYNEGRIEEAEQTIEQIAKIDPGYHAAVEKKKVEDEKEKKVNEHYEKAGGFLREGKFDLAEQEVREIFALFPLHTGAQQLQLQIEEERYKKSEEERNVRLDGERKARAEKDKKIDVLTRAAEDHIDKDELVEARETLQRIYELEPNFVAGERIEEKLRRAEAAKTERERQQSFLQEPKLHPDAVVPQERPVERPQPRPKAVAEEQPRFHIKINWEYVGKVAGAIILVALVYYLYPKVKRALFPVNASIAVVPFNSASGNAQEDTLAYVLPRMLAEDFSRIEHAHIIAPLGKAVQAVDYPNIAAVSQVRYVLHGTVSRSERGIAVNVRLYDNDLQTMLMTEKFEGTVLTLNRVRLAIIKEILDRLDMEDSPPDLRTPTNDAQAYDSYLRGLYLGDRYTLAELASADTALRQAILFDSTFAAAYAELAHVIHLEYELGGAGNAALQEAYECAQKAVRLDPRDYAGYLSLAEVNFLRQQFDKVGANAETSLSLQPDDAGSYGVLAQLDVVEGNYEQAFQNVTLALKRTPDDAHLQLVLGLTQQFRRNYPEAVAAFRQAIALGLPDSLVTGRYLLNAMSARELYDDLAAYYQNILKKNPRDYVAYYGISRAYQMKPSPAEFKTWSEKAMSVLRTYLERNPNDALAHAYLGLLLVRSGKSEDGEAEMANATTLASNSTRILFRRANMYALEGKAKAGLAVSTLKEALGRDFNVTEILNPDLVLLANDSSFTSAITRPQRTE